MHIKIDWLSFSLPFPPSALFNDEQALIVAGDHTAYFLGSHYDTLFGVGDFSVQNGRRPFSISYRNEDSSVAVYLNHKLSHFLIELSGKACERIIQGEDGRRFLEVVRGRVTRIDLACDILCETNPLDFADARGEGRFKSHSEIVSDIGTTYYVGSKKSDRYARVYRYSEPHPRAALLRVEHVFRDDQAKETLGFIIDNGVEKTAAQCALMYKWGHPSWDIKPADEKEMYAVRPEREKANTIYWVYDTVKPLLARLAREGAIDLNEYFNAVWREANGRSQREAFDSETGEML